MDDHKSTNPGSTESESFGVVVSALSELQTVWKSLEEDLRSLPARSGTEVERHLAKVMLEDQRNHVLRRLMAYYERALRLVQGESNRKMLAQSSFLVARTLGTYMGSAALLSSVN